MGLQANVSNVTAHISDSEVELECEMTLYIRPDEDLQWFRGSENITSETNRYTISYPNGLAGAAQNGGNMTIPGRVRSCTEWGEYDDPWQSISADHLESSFV